MQIIQNVLRICKKITVPTIYPVNSRFVALLKFICGSIQARYLCGVLTAISILLVNPEG
jgi:hypothetical protein